MSINAKIGLIYYLSVFYDVIIKLPNYLVAGCECRNFAVNY